MASIQQLLHTFQRQISQGSSFLMEKISSYPNLSLGEQIAYPLIGMGILLLLGSLVLFIL